MLSYPLCRREIRRISLPPPITGGQARTHENFYRLISRTFRVTGRHDGRVSTREFPEFPHKSLPATHKNLFPTQKTRLHRQIPAAATHYFAGTHTLFGGS